MAKQEIIFWAKKGMSGIWYKPVWISIDFSGTVHNGEVVILQLQRPESEAEIGILHFLQPIEIQVVLYNGKLGAVEERREVVDSKQYS